MKISCIIPVYNEAERVEAVIEAVRGCKFIDEIIVINDGSTDDSESALKRAKSIKFISYKKNRGKTHALKIGLEHAKNDWIMTIDSDLIGLKTQDINALIFPVKNNLAKVSMSLRKNSLLTYKLFGLDFVSGERLFEKRLIKNLNTLNSLSGFGFEIFLNKIIVQEKLPIWSVKWGSIITPRKRVKSGFIKGTINDFKMMMEIISGLGPFGVIKQFFAMFKLKQN